MKKISKISFVWLFISVLTSCQQKEGKNMINRIEVEKTNNNLYDGKWLAINKENDTYYYCIDVEKSIEINKGKISDYTPMEDSNFTIDHIKDKGNQTYLYLDKKETSFYILKWVNHERGIISCQLNQYSPNLFIIESKVKTIKNKSCQEKNKSCVFNNTLGKYKFSLEAGEFSNEKEQQYPISAWIIITDMKNKKLQEIHFEPNSWATVINLPCEKFFVKDFNFDGLEDFAILWDTGGSGGELYEYYFQDKKGNFSVIESYPLQHGVLAEEINTLNKTISTQTVVGCCHYNLNTYKLKADGSWETNSQQREITKK